MIRFLLLFALIFRTAESIIPAIDKFKNTRFMHKLGFSPTPETTKANSDPFNSFGAFDKLLFQKFSRAVADEIGTTPPASNYAELISMINQLTFSRPADQVNIQSKRMLVALFPVFLLPMYKAIFPRFFPEFSAWMNTWVTHLTTLWLMGPSNISDLEINLMQQDTIKASIQSTDNLNVEMMNNINNSNVVTMKENLLTIEKCRFLETAGCIQTCLHACKIPTQNFFLEEMGLPVTLNPNMTDYSCRFEFGKYPIPLELDETLQNLSCLHDCPKTNTAVKSCKCPGVSSLVQSSVINQCELQ